MTTPNALQQTIHSLGIQGDPVIDSICAFITQLSDLERERGEISQAKKMRLSQIKNQFLQLIQERLHPTLQQLKRQVRHGVLKDDGTFVSLLDHLIHKVEPRHLPGLVQGTLSGKALRENLEDAIGHFLFEMRYLLLNRVCNHPKCQETDAQKTYVMLFPEIQEEIRDTSFLFNILNQIYTALNEFQHFQTFPPAWVPRQWIKEHSHQEEPFSVWLFIIRIFEKQKLVQPDIWSFIVKELQGIIRQSENALNLWGRVMRYSDRIDFIGKLKSLHEQAYQLSDQHVTALRAFSNKDYDQITPDCLENMIHLTKRLQQTSSDLLGFLKVWMRHLEARTCLQYTMAVQQIDNPDQISQESIPLP
jgi:hypothetical protein